MTLYGSFQTAEFRDVFSRIEGVSKRYTLVPFTINGFDSKGKNGKVIAASIIASPELKNLRRELAEELNKIIRREYRQPWDNEGDYWFHTTIAMKDIDRQYGAIWHYINRKEKPHINQHLVRITILGKGRKIIREYDLILKRWLNRREALSRRLYRETVNKLMELQGLPPEQPTSLLNRLKKIFRFLSQ
jgi:2'-5' RNA ligase